MGIMRAGLTAETYDRGYTNRELFGRIAAYFRPQSRRLFAVMGLVSLLSLSGALLPVLMAQGDEIGADAILTPDGDRLDLAKSTPAVAHATLAAEQVTRALVGRTVADVERDLILETLKHCLGNRTHAANILGISIRTLRNKLNEYADEGQPIPPPGNGEARGVVAA